jgi:hypothetical protein
MVGYECINMMTCPECCYTIPKASWNHHEGACVRKQTCTDCKESMPGRLYANHKIKGKCPELIYPCSLCHTPFKAKLHEAHQKTECLKAEHPDANGCWCDFRKWRTREMWPQHEAKCPQAPVPCPHCKKEMTRNCLQAHDSMCNQKPILQSCKCCRVLNVPSITLTRAEWTNHDCVMECLIYLSKRIDAISCKK